MRLQDKSTGKWYDVGIDEVTEIEEEKYDTELRNNLKTAEFELVYKPDSEDIMGFWETQSKKVIDFTRRLMKIKPKPQTEILHAVYVKKYDPNTQTAICINSWGRFYKPNVSIDIKDIRQLYRVNCSATRLLDL